MSTPDCLRGLSDTDLEAMVAELEERAEFFTPEVRTQVNDELRRRRMRLLGERRR